MSMEAIKSAYLVQGLTVHQKAVLVCLAFYAGPDNRCWPKQETISTVTSIPRESVNRSIKILKARGIVIIDPRAANEPKKSLHYTLVFRDFCDVTQCHNDVTPRHTTCDATSHLSSSIPYPIEPPLNKRLDQPSLYPDSHPDKPKPSDLPKTTHHPTKRRRWAHEPPENYPPGFREFWLSAPAMGKQRSSRVECWQVWAEDELEAKSEEIISALDVYNECPSWQEDEGKWIQGMHIWLSKRKYEERPAGVGA